MSKIRSNVAPEGSGRKLTVTVTKTADGSQDYVQVISADMFSINLVLIADSIVVEDHRKKK